MFGYSLVWTWTLGHRHRNTNRLVKASQMRPLISAAVWLKDMTQHEITPLRLQEAAQAAAADALARMAERMNVDFEEGLLKCTYEGTAEDDAPLHNKTRIVFEWRLLHGQVLKSYALAQTVLRKSSQHKGLVPPIAFQKKLFLACLPTYLQKPPGRGRLAFLRKPDEIRCHRIAHPKPILKYKSTVMKWKTHKTLDTNGTDMEFVLSAHTGVANVYVCVSVHSSSKKKRSFVEVSRAEEDCKERSLTSSDADVDEAVALGIMDKEIRLAKRHKRPLDFEAAISGFSTDFGSSQQSKKMKRSAFLLWSEKTVEGWALRANAIHLAVFKNI